MAGAAKGGKGQANAQEKVNFGAALENLCLKKKQRKRRAKMKSIFLGKKWVFFFFSCDQFKRKQRDVSACLVEEILSKTKKK
jgi:hypothetical protein